VTGDRADTAFPGPPDRGRRFTHDRRVRLGDAGPGGVLRPDGVARYLQDVAMDDWEDSGLGPGATWVVRRTAMRLAGGAAWPGLGEVVTLTTWCSGTGPAWAERRTDLRVGGSTAVETAALWVPVGPTGLPARLGPSFLAVYGPAASGRRVSGRLPSAVVPDEASVRPWALRRADLDALGHVNNAAAWQALVEASGGSPPRATLVHHGPLSLGDEVTLATVPGRLWLTVGGTVCVSGEFAPR